MILSGVGYRSSKRRRHPSSSGSKDPYRRTAVVPNRSPRSSSRHLGWAQCLLGRPVQTYIWSLITVTQPPNLHLARSFATLLVLTLFFAVSCGSTTPLVAGSCRTHHSRTFGEEWLPPQLSPLRRHRAAVDAHFPHHIELLSRHYKLLLA